MLDLTIRIMREEDVTQRYVEWFSREDVTVYSDNQYRSFSLLGQKEYVVNASLNPNLDLYGAFDGDKHIGCITISGIQSFHRRAEIAYVVGEEGYSGKGVATYLVSDISDKARNLYNLHKLFAGCSDRNMASKKVLERNGFTLEGVRKDHLFYNNSWQDQLDYGLIL